MGRLREQEKTWDRRFYQLINYIYNWRVKDVNERVKPWDLFPNLSDDQLDQLRDTVSSAQESYNAVAKQLGAVPRGHL